MKRALGLTFLLSALVASLTEQGFPVLDLTDNELAKLHIRHMVGGHAERVSDEVVLRFEFPERPGALFNFLNKLGGRWNISMFHYRNHGAADVGDEPLLFHTGMRGLFPLVRDAVADATARPATARVVGKVPPTVFLPQPNVDSALVEIRRREQPATDAPRDALFALV